MEITFSPSCSVFSVFQAKVGPKHPNIAILAHMAARNEILVKKSFSNAPASIFIIVAHKIMFPPQKVDFPDSVPFSRYLCLKLTKKAEKQLFLATLESKCGAQRIFSAIRPM